MSPLFENMIVCGKPGGNTYSRALVKDDDGVCPENSYDCGPSTLTCVSGSTDELCPIISVKFDADSEQGF